MVALVSLSLSPYALAQRWPFVIPLKSVLHSHLKHLAFDLW